MFRVRVISDVEVSKLPFAFNAKFLNCNRLQASTLVVSRVSPILGSRLLGTGSSALHVQSYR
jgi:hypothetical protein